MNHGLPHLKGLSTIMENLDQWYIVRFFYLVLLLITCWESCLQKRSWKWDNKDFVSRSILKILHSLSYIENEKKSSNFKRKILTQTYMMKMIHLILKWKLWRQLYWFHEFVKLFVVFLITKILTEQSENHHILSK